MADEDAGVRHPLDPEPVRSTKAAAVFALGVLAVITGPVVAGVVPATVSLVLARQARRDLIAGRGYLTGDRRLRTGAVLAWVGLALAATAVVAAVVYGVIAAVDGAGAGQDFPNTSD